MFLENNYKIICHINIKLMHVKDLSPLSTPASKAIHQENGKDTKTVNQENEMNVFRDTKLGDIQRIKCIFTSMD